MKNQTLKNECICAEGFGMNLSCPIHSANAETPIAPKAENPPKQMEPTPRPWKISRPGYMSGTVVIHGNQPGDGSTNDIAYCDGKNKEADAELICRCVNNYDALIEALKSVVSDLEWGTTGRWKGAGSKSIRDVLAAAEKE